MDYKEGLSISAAANGENCVVSHTNAKLSTVVSSAKQALLEESELFRGANLPFQNFMATQ